MSEHLPISDDALPVSSAGRTTVRQVMKPTTTIEPGAHLAGAAYLIKHFHDSALVVTTDDTQEPIATITDTEINRAIADARDLEDMHVNQIVTAKPVTVDSDLDTEDAARLMLSQGVQRLPVVEGQRLVGIVELADLRRMGMTPNPPTVAKGPL